MKRILIGGTHSGCGKTTLTCAILKALKMRGLKVSSFKCGPDYIDPMFHREIIGTSSANLDGFFCEPDTLRYLLRQGSGGTDIAVIEGVMGYFDGLKTGGSAYDIARLTDTPAVIVINARGMSESLGAIMEGFLRYRQDAHICGFLFNQLPASLADSVREMCGALNTSYLGYLPRNDISLESRNLGLVTAAEIPDLQEKMERLGTLASEYIDLEKLLHLAECSGGSDADGSPIPVQDGQAGKTWAKVHAIQQAESVRKRTQSDRTAGGQAASSQTVAQSLFNVQLAGENLRERPGQAWVKEEMKDCMTYAPLIAVARDAAFCFRYPENIRLLEKLGCRIVYFSPMNDDRIPADADGLYLCGGYPELHARKLSENVSMRESVRQAVTGGMPTIAECGGFLYLHRELRTENPADAADGNARPDGAAAADSGIAGAASAGGDVWPMAGVLDAAAFPKKSLQRFGYISMTARSDNLLCEKGDQIRAHEFHYWDSECSGDLFEARKPDGRSWRCGIGTQSLYAGFPHLYFYAKPEMAVRFVKKCAAYQEMQNETVCDRRSAAD